MLTFRTGNLINDFKDITMAKKACKDGDLTGGKNDREKNYYCKSCGAEAVKEKHLCKPKKI